MKILNVGLSRSMQPMCADTTCISVCARTPGYIAPHHECSELPDCLHNGACSPKEAIGDRPHTSLCNEELFGRKSLGSNCVAMLSMWGRKVSVDPWLLFYVLGKKYLLHTYATYNAYKTMLYCAHGHTSAHTASKRSKIGEKRS